MDKLIGRIRSWFAHLEIHDVIGLDAHSFKPYKAIKVNNQIVRIDIERLIDMKALGYTNDDKNCHYVQITIFEETGIWFSIKRLKKAAG